MEQEVLERRNEVFDALHRRATVFYALYVRKTMQWTIEVLLLSMASVMLLLWGYIHFTYMTSPADCLHQITEQPFPRDVILQVEVYSNSTRVWKERQYALMNLYESTIHSSRTENSEGMKQTGDTSDSIDQKQWWISNDCANAVTYWTGTQFLCELFLSSVDFQIGEVKNDEIEQPDTLGPNVMTHSNESSTTNVSKETFFSQNRTLHELLDPYSLKMLCFDYAILEFAQEPGYLSLTPSSRKKLNITVYKVYLDPDEASCFGGPIGVFLSTYFLGYDTLVIASFKALLPEGHGSGFVKNLLTGDQYYYKVQWMGKWRYGAGVLPLLFFTLVASVLLRQIHYHIFKFLTHFQHLINQGLPMPVQTGAQIPLMIVTYAGIGLVIVMSEALGDDSLFSLLMVGTVWEADQFYSLLCKHQISRNYFPWFFFLYHFVSYAYYIRFSGQFWFVTFTLHFILLQHAMFYFLHRFELPRDNVQHNRRHPQQAAAYLNLVLPHHNIVQGVEFEGEPSDNPVEPTDNTTQPLRAESTRNAPFGEQPLHLLEDESVPDVIRVHSPDVDTYCLTRQLHPEVVRNPESDNAMGD